MSKELITIDEITAILTAISFAKENDIGARVNKCLLNGEDKLYAMIAELKALERTSELMKGIVKKNKTQGEGMTMLEALANVYSNLEVATKQAHIDLAMQQLYALTRLLKKGYSIHDHPVSILKGYDRLVDVPICTGYDVSTRVTIAGEDIKEGNPVYVNDDGLLVGYSNGN